MTSRLEIRILDLLPGKDDDRIHCEIRVAALSEVQYEALSYVWGHRLSKKTVQIAGHEVEVTENLYNALWRLRDSFQKRALWIDQLCINQWDNAEKTQHVNMMRLIYKSCQRCLIWLGEIAEDSDEFNVSDAKIVLDLIQLIATTPENTAQAFDTSQALEQACNAFWSLVSNPWWGRIWTVQEVVLPSIATVHWGALSIPWKYLEQAAAILCSGQTSEELDSHLAQFGDVVNYFTGPVRGLEFARSGEEAVDLIHRWRYRAATDPRDKVYALMGLFPHMPLPNIQSCDYEISTAALYTLVTFDLLQLDQGLDALIGREGEPHETEGLPTWVIDWTECNDKTKRVYRWWRHRHRYYMFQSDGGQPFYCDLLDGSSILSLQGVLVDTIVDVQGPMKATTQASVEIAETIQRWENMLHQSQRWHWDGPYAGGGTATNAFWRTLLGDLIMEEHAERRVEDTDYISFCDFRHNLPDSHLVRTSLLDMLVQTFFITASGYIGVGPPNTRTGDDIWVLFGGRFPFVLRPKVDGISDFMLRKYDLVGDAYVHGIMDGEAIGDCEERQEKVFLH